MPLSRRALLSMVPAGLLASALRPSPLRADDASERRFLFIYARGGWDPAYVFTQADAAHYQPAETRLEDIGGLPIMDAPGRPSVRRFFERHAGDTCIINGFEVRSVTHERCARLVLTGRSQDTADDWPAILAGESLGYTLPGIVVKGPSYSAAHTRSVVRLGKTGQLSTLLDGSALNNLDAPLRGLDPSAEDLVNQFVQRRSEAFAVAATEGRQAKFADDQLAALEQLGLLRALEGQVDLGLDEGDGYVGLPDRVQPALDAMELGLCRCAMVEHAGLWDVGWDTHTGIESQSEHFERLFNDLVIVRDDIAQRPGFSGDSLADDVTIVVISEMGRAPLINPVGGKDHWTFTSAMIMGPGVAGGQVIGGFDGDLLGRKINLSTGQLDDGGTLMTSANLGATLLTLGGVDPSAYLDGSGPIEAALL